MESELPDWAIKMVGELVVEANGTPTMDAIARALVAAERRGIEYGAAYLERRAAEWRKIGKVTSNTFANIYEDEATAIRQLGGEP